MSGVKDGDMNATIKISELEDNPIEIRTIVTKAQLTTYACPMNDVTSEDPGKCPKCGMEMTAVSTSGKSGGQPRTDGGQGRPRTDSGQSY